MDTPTPNNPFAPFQEFFSQAQQSAQHDWLELYKAGLDYTAQVTTLTLDAARRSLELFTPKA